MTNYVVNFWGSHPDLGNDDCSGGSEHDTLPEARIAFEKGTSDYCISHIELCGPMVREVRENPAHDPKKRERDSRAMDDEWRQERAMQAGMAFGVDGYNDEMGYSLDDPNE